MSKDFTNDKGIIDAVSKSQAIIEFKPDGTIVTANENFLNAVGYQLNEIQGKHHSIFVDTDYKRSKEYKEFWTNLNNGKFDSGQYKRYRKDGSEIWIQASYNPIFTDGELSGVVKFATDITQQKLEYANFQGQMDAVSKSQAVIEFELDGTIITANENFTATVGYSLAEIQGKHHSIFVDPHYRLSQDYKNFWQNLRDGKFDSGQYKRFGKDGTEIWIQASYNPIFDMNGKPFKVVKYATNITQQKMDQANFQGQIDAVSKSQAVIEFELDGTIITANENFTATVGYSLEEIQGSHHSMFVDPSYKLSQEYKNFWQNLREGKFDSGQYKRFGKGGKEIWIQASYNPILDMNGKPFKVVKYATNITQQKLDQANFEGQMEAVSKAQAVIEFELDGTIITANENFTSTVGYSLDEIKGKHHSIFVEPSYKESFEYKDFWHKLNQGQFDSGQYKRFGKGGKEIWIQASYNPILDMNGKPFKVVKFASDITQEKLNAIREKQEMQDYQDEMTRLEQACEQGELTKRGDLSILSESWIPVMTAVNSIIDAIVKPINEIQSSLEKLSTGDLTAYVTGEYKGDHEILKVALNSTLDNLNNILHSVNQAAVQMADGSGQVSDSSQSISQGATEQAASLEQITASMNEISSQTNHSAESANKANDLSSNVRSGAETGTEMMNNMLTAMNEIDDSAQKISKIIKVIDEIAFQTNLLALNAAVEAARAGVHGKGFAVVAEEVRNLAARSANAAKETTELIEGSIKKVDAGTKVANSTSEALNEIVEGISTVTTLISEIAASSTEQSQGINQVNQGLVQLDQVTQQNTANSEESAAAALELSQQAQQLTDILKQFKLKDKESNRDINISEISPELLEQIKLMIAPQPALAMMA